MAESSRQNSPRPSLIRTPYSGQPPSGRQATGAARRSEGTRPWREVAEGVARLFPDHGFDLGDAIEELPEEKRIPDR